MGALALSPERQSARMSKIKTGGLDQYGAEPLEQQQFETAGVEGVKLWEKYISKSTVVELMSIQQKPRKSPVAQYSSKSDTWSKSSKLEIHPTV